MKKLGLFFLLVVLSLFSVKAQTLLSEDFESATSMPPQGWSVINDSQENSHFHWTLYEDDKSAISGKKSARVECGGYTYDEPIKEEWLITPLLQLTDDSYKVEFKWVGASAAAIDKQEYDFQVRVQIDGQSSWTTIWSFLNKDQVEDSGIKYPWTGWLKYTSLIDLTNYKGKSIKIAFVHCKLKPGLGVGNDIKVDDILVQKYDPILNPQIESATSTYTFPVSYIGSKKYSEVLSFKNIGSGVLKVTSVSSSNSTDFSTTIIPGEVELKKNEEYQFQLIYQPTLSGAPNTTIKIETNGGTPLEIKVSGSKRILPEGYTYESFEGNVFPPLGWRIEGSGWNVYNAGLSGDRSAVVSICEKSELISPRLNLSGNQEYTVNFDFLEDYEPSSDDGGLPENYFRLYLSTDGGATWGKPLFDNVDLNQVLHKEISLGSPKSDNCYLKWSYTLPGLNLSGGYDELPEYSNVYLDDVVLPPLYGSDKAPSAATGNIPANNATDIYNKNLVLSWGGVLFATNYKVYVGTESNKFDIVNGESTGLNTSYTLNRLDYAKTYYWKVVPSNAAGEATNVPVWNFTVMADQSVKSYPYIQGFDEKTFPLGWNTTKEGYTRWDLSQFNAFDGNGSAYAGGSTSNSTAILESPEFVLPTDKEAQITFYWGNGVPAGLQKDPLGTAVNNTTGPNDIDAGYFEIDVDGTWTTLAIMSDKDNVYWVRERVALDAYKGKTVTFRWRYHVVDGLKSKGVSIDNVKVELIGSECMAYFNKNEWNAGEVNYLRSFSSKNILSLTNGGSETLKIKNVKFSKENFTTTLQTGITLEANKGTVFAVIFNAGTVASEIKDEMVVSFENGQSVSLPVSGIALPEDVLYYSFEDDEFASTSPKGLTTVDVDALATVKPVMINYPKIGTPFAYIVINQKPEPEGADWRNIYPRSGDQLLAAMCDQTHSSSTNDWIISGELTATPESNFRFYGKSYAPKDQFNLHHVSVWVSTTDKNISSFELVSGNIELPHKDDYGFTEFNVDLSKYAGQKIYVGLQHIADKDGFVAFFDDFYFEHFSYDMTGISQHSIDNDIRVYPNPVADVLYVETNDVVKLTVSSLSGSVVLSEENVNSIDVSSLPVGIYLVTIQTDDKVQTTRIIKK